MTPPLFRRANGSTPTPGPIVEGGGGVTTVDEEGTLRAEVLGAEDRGFDPRALTDARDLVSIGPDDGATSAAQLPSLPLWRQMLRVFAKNHLAVVSVVFLFIVVLGCYVGPIFYKTNQTNAFAVLFQPQNLPPSIHHLLGTDNQGFDELGRVMYGGQFSLTLGALAGFITIVVGTVYGMVSGFMGGIVDAILMRIIDAMLSIPYIFLLIALIVVFGNSTTFLILVIGLTGWWGNARIIRADALAIRDLEYSQAAASMGARKLHIVRKHVFPNSISNIVTVGTFSIADSILFLSALGFLGLGIQPPGTDWGTMLNTGVSALYEGYWWEVYPVSALFILVIVAINYIGDALRDVFEVRLRER